MMSRFLQNFPECKFTKQIRSQSERYPLELRSSSLNEKCYFSNCFGQNLLARRESKNSKDSAKSEHSKGIYSVDSLASKLILESLLLLALLDDMEVGENGLCYSGLMAINCSNSFRLLTILYLFSRQDLRSFHLLGLVDLTNFYLWFRSLRSIYIFSASKVPNLVVQGLVISTLWS